MTSTGTWAWLAALLLVAAACSDRIVDAVRATDAGRPAAVLDAGFDEARNAPDAAGDRDAEGGSQGDAATMAPTALGLVAHFRLDEGQGSTASDGSGRDNHGALQNGPRWVAGRTGAALSFTDQSANSVRVPASGSLDALAALTVSAWVFTLGSGWQQTIVSRQLGAGVDQRYSLHIFHSTVRFGGRGRVITRTLSPFPARRWFHLAATFDGATARLYVDGALVAMGPAGVTLGPDSTPVLLGAEQEGPNLWSSMNGLLDEVRVYDRALTDAEIAVLAR